MTIRPTTAFLVSSVVVAIVMTSCADNAEREAESLAAWDQVASVLQHPRCLNCHQMDVPLQGDEARTHTPLVVRGADNHGIGAMRCGNCHNQMGNNDTAGVPGAPHWQLSPESMVWQGLSSRQLCESLLDPERNGNRSHQDLIEHMGQDPLVLWGWDPGDRRQAVPVPHDQFVETLETWLDTGAHCPSDSAMASEQDT